MPEPRFMGIPRETLSWWPKVDPELCIGCGECIEFCPNGVYELDEVAGVVEVVKPMNCVVLCDKCAASCPQEAIMFPDKAQMKALVVRLMAEQQSAER